MFDSLSDKLQDIIRKTAGCDKLTEENMSDALREIRRALLEADVNLRVVKAFVSAIRDRAEGEAVVKGVDPAQQLIKIVNDELVKILGSKNEPLNLTGHPNIIMMLGLLILFSTYVFPRFMAVFTFNGAQLPFLADMLVGICSFIMNYWWFVILGFGAFCGGCVALFKNQQFKRKWDNFILKVPAISGFIEYINLSNFMTVLHISYDAGLPIMSGLELSSKTVGNYTIKQIITGQPLEPSALIKRGIMLMIKIWTLMI